MVIDRFVKYMNYKGLNDNQVTTQCDLSVGLIGKARKGRSDIGRKAIEKILANYPDINRVWLLTGEGEMLKSSSSSGDIVITNTNGNGNAVGGSSVSTSSEELAVLRAETKMQKEQIERLYKQIEKLEAQNEKLLNAITK